MSKEYKRRKLEEFIDWEGVSKDIKSMYDEGCTLVFIAKKYGVSRQRIHQVVGELGIANKKRKKK